MEGQQPFLQHTPTNASSWNKKPGNESPKRGLEFHRPWKIHNSTSLHETLEGIRSSSRRRWESFSEHLAFLFCFFFPPSSAQDPLLHVTHKHTHALKDTFLRGRDRKTVQAVPQHRYRQDTILQNQLWQCKKMNKTKFKKKKAFHHRTSYCMFTQLCHGNKSEIKPHGDHECATLRLIPSSSISSWEAKIDR